MQEKTLPGQQVQAGQKTSGIVIANPTAGGYLLNGYKIREVVRYLQAHGWQVELKLTQAAGDAAKLAREAVAQKLDAVVVMGGDGTINEVIQELAGSETALGVLPSGTVNVWAREVEIPLAIEEAREVLIKKHIKSIDLGKVNDRYFLLMAGIGFDGEVTHAVEKKPVKRFGVLGYLFVGTWLGVGYSPFRATLDLDDKVIKANALQIIVGNTQLYAGTLKYTWLARCDDGQLDICIIHKQGIIQRFLLAIDFILYREQRHQWTRYETGKSLTIRTRRPIAIQIDGDPYGYTADGDPATTIRVVPNALKMIIPSQTANPLFAETDNQA